MKNTPPVIVRGLTMVAALSVTLVPQLASAHEGHGMPGLSHWHATDVLGFVAVVGAVVAYTWFKGGKK